MSLGRGFKYFLRTTTRFPEINLDLYVPRKLSTTHVDEIIFDQNKNAYFFKDKDPNSNTEINETSSDWYEFIYYYRVY